MLADAFVLSSGEMEDVFNKEKESPHNTELQKLPESVRSLSPVNDQVSGFLFLFKKDYFNPFSPATFHN